MLADSTFSSPTVAEISARLDRLQEEMRRQSLDWYLSFDPINIYYLTHFANFVHERPFILLVPVSGRPSFVAPKLEIPHIECRRVGELDLVDYFEFPAPDGLNWFDRVNDIIGGAAKVGVESACTLQIREGVRAECVRSDIIDNLRLIKSPYEVARMVYSGRIVSTVMTELLANAVVGQSLIDVVGASKTRMMELMIRDNPAINVLATRTDAAFQPPSVSDDPHNFTNLAMAMEEGGPHVSIINAVLNGYGSEIERTFFLGHVPEEAKRPFETMMEARELAFDMVRPGVRMSDVDAAVNARFRARGYADNLLHRTGHGMGVTGHEAPFLAEGDHRLIQPGMSFTIEPGIYLKGVGGFRHSDTIMVTEAGNVALTHASSTLADLVL